MAKQGQVITFYSYKGGTGRSMLLANVACLLTEQNNLTKVLIIDWDLEAPGLHRYFQNYLSTSFPNISEDEEKFNLYPGLIDLFFNIRSLINDDPTYLNTFDEMMHMLVNDCVIKTDISSLFMIKAGRFDENYGSRVSKFNWDDFYHLAPNFFHHFVNWLTKRYDYILIDSRTGISDTSGICTRLLPEKLIAVFTPNRQSLMGLLELVERSTEFRRNSEDTRPLITFPVPSRVENAESKLREDWRYGNKEQNIYGYQPEFERLFENTYALSKCNLQNYFDKVQIQHVPAYLYGEQIAVLSERNNDRLSLTDAYFSFTDWMTEYKTPWANDRQSLLIQDSSQRWDVFLSYSTKDKEFAALITDNLRSSGITVWNYNELNIGKELIIELEEAIKNSSTLVVLLSPDSAKSEFVQSEIAYAIGFQKFILPIVVRGDFNESVPFVLKTRQLLDMREAKKSSFSRLIREIHQVLEINKKQY